MRSRLLACAFVVLVALVAACSNNAAPAGAAGDALELGKDTEVTAGKTYRVGDVAVTVVTISMASGQTAEGHDTHRRQDPCDRNAPGRSQVATATSPDVM